ncbi:protein SUPPRESSOR OF GENE SILENCING 3-like [Hibiscus syriacus]|uniref:protein SUPPRESSOR OF GENE SILENCING 3-like n=1 Tax=Hibiscus syriacus TaxID=106335 RepID=UPI001923FEA9|nr:protein SUPPRESSOR OF GENE SILENCING 3-like [Hibiscus syriacus]
MDSGLAFDLLLGVGNDYENKIFDLSYAAFAEELQLQEILKESMITSENAACEAIKNPGCPVCNRLSCMECTIPHPTRAQRFLKPVQVSAILVDIYLKQISSNEFHAKTSSLCESDRIAGTGNTEDPNGKGIAIDDGGLLISKRKSDSRVGNRADKRLVDVEHPNPLKDYDYDSLNDDDEFDSDDSQKSHESGEKSTWFKEFLERMDALNIKEIDETLWHCPVCQGGPGSTKWYRSISDLIAHSKKIGSRRVKLHRELAKLLEGELCIKGTSIPPAGPISGTWKGLTDDARDLEIVWPPLVVIMNTMTSNIQDGKFIGMGNQELLDYFSSYPALKAQHSYGRQGHRGLSVLIFEKSVVGYLEAERLHKNFLEQRLGRSAWNSCTNEVLSGGERQLYGFMALKEDLDVFNQHCQGKSKIKFEVKSVKRSVITENVLHLFHYLQNKFTRPNPLYTAHQPLQA